jgi:tRNA(adenine34) deaminase
MRDDKYFMQIALDEAQKSLLEDEVPVGAVIVYQDEVIARGHNLIRTRKDPTAHAELIAISAASRYLQYERLLDCSLYVTLEPCAMCAGAIVWARIKRLIFGATDPKAGCCGTLYNLPQDERFNHYVEITSGVLEKECSEIISSFFREIRLASNKTNISD